MKLPKYKNFLEKNPFFESLRINNIHELSKIEELRSSNCFYRGVHEAKYKIYSSAQRDWITKDLHTVFNTYGYIYFSVLIQHSLQQSLFTMARMLQ